LLSPSATFFTDWPVTLLAASMTLSELIYGFSIKLTSSFFSPNLLAALMNPADSSLIYVIAMSVSILICSFMRSSDFYMNFMAVMPV